MNFKSVCEAIQEAPELSPQLLRQLGEQSLDRPGSQGRTNRLLNLIADKLPRWEPISFETPHLDVMGGDRDGDKVLTYEMYCHNGQWFERKSNQRVYPTHWTPIPRPPRFPMIETGDF